MGGDEELMSAYWAPTGTEVSPGCRSKLNRDGYPALRGTQRDSGLLWRLWHGVKGDEGGGFRAGLFSLGGGQESLFSRTQQKTRVTGSVMGGSPI